MLKSPPRVAYFPDSFHEVNGVAHTSRHFEGFARRHELPFLCVRSGERKPQLKIEGHLWTLELPRGFLAFAVEKDLFYDVGFVRHIPLVGEVLDRFKPDLIHITGPNDMGMLGAGLAYDRGIPLAASWHTNVHEYLARRSATWIANMMTPERIARVEQTVEDWTMAVAAKFYSIAQVLYAPNPELCALLERATGRKCFLMPRGVDTELFSPARRNRKAGDNVQLLGFVGRLSVEKNVTLLAQIHDELLARGVSNFRFLIVGHGAEEQWLRERMPQAEFTGVLKGDALSEAYANMDLLVFPSHTDTFGNVVLEALASGVPAVVTPDGGPKTIVTESLTGRIATDEDFTEAVAGILGDAALHERMRKAAREYSLKASWDSVFEGVYSAYQELPLAR
jgi:glycosyltransferase involved in cell wall biosynthesis